MTLAENNSSIKNLLLIAFLCDLCVSAVRDL